MEDAKMDDNMIEGEEKATRVATPTQMLFVHNTQLHDATLFKYNAEIKEDYEEVLGSPRAYKDSKCSKCMDDCTKKVFGSMYKYTKIGCYYCMVVTFGLCLSLIWAFVLAINQWTMDWLVKPSIKLAFTWMKMIYMCCRPWTRVSMDPFFQAIGQMFSACLGNIHLTVHGTGGKKIGELSAV